jgi:multidrug efflux pump subunit AcrB
MGVTVVGGMFFATFLTLFVVPTVYSYMAGRKKAETNIDEQPHA